MNTSDPVYLGEDGKWRYCDETWNDSGDGPFDTEVQAREALRKYCHWLETGEAQ